MHALPLDTLMDDARLRLSLLLLNGEVPILAVPKVGMDLPPLIHPAILLNRIRRARLVRTPRHHAALTHAQLRARPGVRDPVLEARLAALLPRADVVAVDPRREGVEGEGLELLLQVDDVHLPEHGERARDADGAGEGLVAPGVVGVGLGLGLAVGRAGGWRAGQRGLDDVAAAQAVEVAVVVDAWLDWLSGCDGRGCAGDFGRCFARLCGGSCGCWRCGLASFGGRHRGWRRCTSGSQYVLWILDVGMRLRSWQHGRKVRGWSERETLEGMCRLEWRLYWKRWTRIDAEVVAWLKCGLSVVGWLESGLDVVELLRFGVKVVGGLRVGWALSNGVG